jgi:hypothetical protein
MTGTNDTHPSAGTVGGGIPCLVSVIVNNIKPYHNATAYGPFQASIRIKMCWIINPI